MVQDEVNLELVDLCFDANDPLTQARFWAEALRWEVDDRADGEVGLAPTDGTRFGILFEPVAERWSGVGRTQQVGYFWSEALGWPLIWDQDQETAIGAPGGTGPIIAWGGPPVAPKVGKNRLHLDVAPPDGIDQHAAVDRLIALGASRTDIGQGDVSWVLMADPDGNELCVLGP